MIGGGKDVGFFLLPQCQDARGWIGRRRKAVFSGILVHLHSVAGREGKLVSDKSVRNCFSPCSPLNMFRDNLKQFDDLLDKLTEFSDDFLEFDEFFDDILDPDEFPDDLLDSDDLLDPPPLSRRSSELRTTHLPSEYPPRSTTPPPNYILPGPP